MRNYLKLFFWSFSLHGAFLIYLFFTQYGPVFIEHWYFVVTLGGTALFCGANLLLTIFEFIRPHFYFRPIYRYLGWGYAIFNLIVAALTLILIPEYFWLMKISLIFFGLTLIQFWGFASYFSISDEIENYQTQLSENGKEDNSSEIKASLRRKMDTQRLQERRWQNQGYNQQYFNFLAMVAAVIAILYIVDLMVTYSGESTIQLIYGIIILAIQALLLLEIIFQFFIRKRTSSITGYTAFRVIVFTLMYIIAWFWASNFEIIFQIPLAYLLITSSLSMKYKAYSPLYGTKMSYSI